MNTEIQTGDPATEWRRSNPDIVVYLPKEPGLNDGDNEHFLAFESPSGRELLAMWNQSSCEGRGDNHIVIARSSDGEAWSEPELIAGSRLSPKSQRSCGAVGSAPPVNSIRALFASLGA